MLGLHAVAPGSNSVLTSGQDSFSVFPDSTHKISLGAREGLQFSQPHLLLRSFALIVFKVVPKKESGRFKVCQGLR